MTGTHGVGKTTLIDDFVAAFPRVVEVSGTPGERVARLAAALGVR